MDHLGDDKSVEHTMLTVDQTAERLQVSKSIVYSLIERGKLVCYRIGLGRGTIRVSVSDLENFLTNCRDGGSSSSSRRTGKRLRHIEL
jgi:excisionase family DNA binding protein